MERTPAICYAIDRRFSPGRPDLSLSPILPFMVGTWFSEQGVVIMLVELAFMIGILLPWYLFRPTLSRLRNTVG
ncbi:amino acid permease [Salmonella enterica subsp. enterica]|uniref:Amino acid permease n=1 Tax=Salmonella enterica I TaxID=59201 RepID=A0A379W5T8_SALET|nr:amino acid permease [Salmonella enterica subsp. enterica]